MDSIAIEGQKQNVLNKNVKKIQKRLKRGIDSKKEAKKLKFFQERGVVYLGHIPHGFYEDGIQAYASQFGHVTRVRVARSKRTGRSKGFAFVEFRNSDVAKIFAETVDNYLMFNRILKCHFIEPEKRHPNMFKSSITATKFPAQKNQERDTQLKNATLDLSKEEDRLKKARQRLETKKAEMKAQGIDFNFAVNDPCPESAPSSNETPAILEIDESDDEIEFKTPPHAIKVYKKTGSAKKADTPKAAPKEKLDKKKRGKIRYVKFFLTKVPKE